MAQLINLPIDDSCDGEYDRVCNVCSAIFSPEVIATLFNDPEEAMELPHLTYAELRLSAQRCHLCAWLNPEHYGELEHTIDGKHVSSPLYRSEEAHKDLIDEKIFVNIGGAFFGGKRLWLSTNDESKVLSYEFELSQIVGYPLVRLLMTQLLTLP
jgi:hypothetical protein